MRLPLGVCVNNTVVKLVGGVLLCAIFFVRRFTNKAKQSTFKGKLVSHIFSCCQETSRSGTWSIAFVREQQ
jgi:hypothetical protein